MGQLECSEIKLSNILFNNQKFRIDDEYFRKEIVNSYNVITRNKYVLFEDIIEVLTDFHSNGSYESIAKVFKLLDNPDYAYMVRTTDLEMNNYDTNVKYVSRECYNYLSKSKVYGGELLINKIGNPGQTFIMPYLNMPVSLGMNLFMIRLKKDCNFTEAYLWAYLNSEIGKNIISRYVSGTVPLTIDKLSIKSIPVPYINSDFQYRIADMVKSAHSKLEESKMLYRQAEEILEKELGIDYDVIEQKKDVESSVRSFRDVSCGDMRIDSEYYLTKYDELFSHLKNANCCTLSSIVNIRKSIEPGSNMYQSSGIPFYRISNISEQELSKPDIYLDETLFDKSLFPKKDTILFSKDGSIGIAYKLQNDLLGITSSALLHLTVKDENILPDYLTLVLNSKIVKMQSVRDSGGSIIVHWRMDDIANVSIPVLPFSIQTTIAEKVQNSFRLRAESKQLLEDAKRLVEEEIEKGGK